MSDRNRIDTFRGMADPSRCLYLANLRTRTQYIRYLHVIYVHVFISDMVVNI